MKQCLKWGSRRVENCAEERDEGTNQCVESRDEGYRNCCDWWPCSWACDAWVWISHVVCVAWQWFEDIVCVAWSAVTTFFCMVWELVVTIAAPFAWVVEFVESIPILGRLVKWLLSAVETIISFVLSLVDFLASWLGITIEKKLLLCVIVQKDEQGNPVVPTTGGVTPEAAVMPGVQFLIDAFMSQASVRVLPAVGDNYVHVADWTSGSDTLDVCSEACAFGADLTGPGSTFTKFMMKESFWESGRRLLGLGAPVYVFAVRRFTDGKRGCSLGLLSDYVLVNFNTGDDAQMTTLAHEVAHACGLNPMPFHTHSDDPSNLMWPNAPHKANLDQFQIAWLRASRHVTFI
jgi:hypothetical protein